MPLAPGLLLLREQLLLHRHAAHLQRLYLRRGPLRVIQARFGQAPRRSLRTSRNEAFAAKHRHQALGRSFQTSRRQLHTHPRLRVNQASKNTGPSPDPTSQLGSPASTPTPSLSERLRKLSREYGWTALGVYMALSALDFPFCFLAVRMLGTDRIAGWEQSVVHTFWTVLSMPFPGGEEQIRGVFRRAQNTMKETLEAAGMRRPQQTQEQGAHGDVVSKPAGQPPDAAVIEEKWSWGVDEAEAAHRDHASLATQLALAYAVHKSFIFLRVPLTAAVLPRVVKTLRGWGWKIGKRPSKATENF